MLSRAATAEDPNELPPGDDLQQGALAVLPLLPEPAAGQPIILPLLAQAGLARAGGAVCMQSTLVPVQPRIRLCHQALTVERDVQIVQRSSAPGVGPADHMMIEGIKHRILAYLYRAYSLDGPSSDAVRKFFYDFQDYTDLIIWKVRLPPACCNLCLASQNLLLSRTARHIKHKLEWLHNLACGLAGTTPG